MEDAKKYSTLSFIMADIGSKLSANIGLINYQYFSIAPNEINFEANGAKFVLLGEYVNETAFQIKAYRIYKYEGENGSDLIFHVPYSNIVAKGKDGYILQFGARSITDNFAEEYMKILYKDK